MSNHESLEDVLRRLDRPVAPSPGFKERLERRLMAELGHPSGAQGGTNLMDRTAVAPKTWRDSTEPSARRRSWLPVLEIAAVLLIAIGIGAAVLGSRGMLPGQSNDNHAAILTEYPITPDPSECTVEPRTVEEVESVVPDSSQEPAEVEEPQATPPITLQHSNASNEVADEIESAYRMWVACLNAGDQLRLAALQTDDVLRSGSFSSDEQYDESVPAPIGERVTILDFSYAREFADGRAGAVLVVNSENAPAAITPFFFIFKKVEDRWLIDGFPMWWSVETGESYIVEEGWGTPIAIGTMPIETPTVVKKPTETP